MEIVFLSVIVGGGLLLWVSSRVRQASSLEIKCKKLEENILLERQNIINLNQNISNLKTEFLNKISQKDSEMKEERERFVKLMYEKDLALRRNRSIILEKDSEMKEEKEKLAKSMYEKDLELRRNRNIILEKNSAMKEEKENFIKTMHEKELELTRSKAIILEKDSAMKQEKKNFTKSMHEKELEIKKSKAIILEKDYAMKEEKKSFVKSMHEKDLDLTRSRNIILEKDAFYKNLSSLSEFPFRKVASLIADFQTIQYEISAKYLETKERPAHKAAKDLRGAKEEIKVLIEKNRIMNYKYEYIFGIFPDLEQYVDDIQSIAELNQYETIEGFSEENDRVRNYISKEEYEKLSIDERNQLALDKYISSQKSKWQIGRDYEMFVGHEYEKDGWAVEYCGIEKQLEDMGRDLICKKGHEIHIVQCKYWSQKKMIHEKHIAQLYGTAIQYEISEIKSDLFGIQVIPVFITNIQLSETARKFARHLKVKIIENKALSEFPRIKCNLNRDEYGNETKIYHLPFDQQYDKVKIHAQGEFYALTVKEAVSKGFRRAFRWRG